MDSRHLRRGILAAYLLATVVLFLAPIGSPDVASKLPVDPDKLAHFGLIAVLAAGVWWVLPARRGRAAIAFLVAAGYALAIEGIQALLPYRTGDAFDLVAGALGASVGAALAKLGAVLARHLGRRLGLTRA